MDRQASKPRIHSKPCGNAYLKNSSQKDNPPEPLYLRLIAFIISIHLPSQTVLPFSPQTKPKAKGTIKLV